MNNLLPPGSMTALLLANRVVITNACPSICMPSLKARAFTLGATDNGFTAAPDLTWMDLKALGLGPAGHAADCPQVGKFICFRDGLFILSPEYIDHSYLPGLVDRPGRSVIGAGFIQAIMPDGLYLTGESHSLGGIPICQDHFDYSTIAKHLQMHCPVRYALSSQESA